MQIQPRGMHQVLTRRWGNLPGLSQGERDLLSLADAKHTVAYSPGALLASAGAVIRTPLVIVSGWVCIQRMLANGRRQIVFLFLPGDIIGLDGGTSLAPEAVVALTPAGVAPCPELNVIHDRQPLFGTLRQAVSVAALEDRQYLHDTIIRLGRQVAYERVAHFLIELEHRLQSRGMDVTYGFALPVTQEILADILGMSVVHVNRTFQQLRRDGLIEARAGRIRVLDRTRLQAAAEFRPPVVATSPHA